MMEYMQIASLAMLLEPLDISPQMAMRSRGFLCVNIRSVKAVKYMVRTHFFRIVSLQIF
jgi:hypothetical protein